MYVPLQCWIVSQVIIILQASTVILALTLARDEVFWLMKHSIAPTPKGKHKVNPDDYSDPHLPELLFGIVQLKGQYM